MGRERGHRGGKGKEPWGRKVKDDMRMVRERRHGVGGNWEGIIKVEEGGGEGPNCVRWIDIYLY